MVEYIESKADGYNRFTFFFTILFLSPMIVYFAKKNILGAYTPVARAHLHLFGGRG